MPRKKRRKQRHERKGESSGTKVKTKTAPRNHHIREQGVEQCEHTTDESSAHESSTDDNIHECSVRKASRTRAKAKAVLREEIRKQHKESKPNPVRTTDRRIYLLVQGNVACLNQRITGFTRRTSTRFAGSKYLPFKGKPARINGCTPVSYTHLTLPTILRV